MNIRDLPVKIIISPTPYTFPPFTFVPSIDCVKKSSDGSDVKMVSPRSQSDLLQSSLCNLWSWSVNWDLPINPTKCNYIAIGRATPLQLSLVTGSPGISIQAANVVRLHRQLLRWFGPILSTLCRSAHQNLLPTPII